MIAVMAGGPAAVMPPPHGAAAAATRSATSGDSKVAAATPAKPASSGDASRAGGESRARPAGDAAAGVPDGADTAPAKAAAARDAGRDATELDAAASGEFAALLAASGPTEAPGATDVAPTATALSTADAADSGARLPEQILALLSGSRTMPVIAAATAPIAAHPAKPSLPPAIALPDGPAVAAPAPGGAVVDAVNARAPVTALAALLAVAHPATDRPGSDAESLPAPETVALTAAAPAAATARAAPPPAAPLALPVDPDAGFDDGFGTRIVWMAEQRLGHAQIRLNPEHVGPIDVRVQLDGNRVSAEFSSAQAEVRQAIEASLPRLREMLGQHGLQLGQADVGQGQSGRRDARTKGDGQDPAHDADVDPRLTTMPVRATRGLLDEYA